ncbi:hypothetical protein ScPMuIL_008461 [Solemya velum]
MATAFIQDNITTHRDQETSLSSARPRCLKCVDKCPGLDLHTWRKICRYCRCALEDHDLHDTNTDEHKPANLLYDSLPRYGNKEDLLSRLERLTLEEPKTHAQIGPSDDIVISRIVSENLRSQEYIANLPKDKQLFAAQLRRRQLQKQLPLHDLHEKFCDSLTEKEVTKFQKFAEKRRNKASGIGEAGALPDSGEYFCHRCKQIMEPSSIAIFPGRMSLTTNFHPGCFTCATCQELMVDMIYFYKKGDIYCCRHYNDLIYPRCSACDEMILAREYTQAENQSWHVQHFCCWYCDAALAGRRYIAKNSNPYCIACFDRIFSKMCSTCGHTITADSPGLSHGDYHWHACPHCFCCHACAANLINQQFLLKDGKLFCCMQCKQSFVSRHKTSFSPHYHS